MKLRKLMVIIILTIFLFSIASVTAANTTDVMTSVDDSSQKNDEILSKENEEIIKDGTTGTFTELRDKINNGGSEITLDKNYSCEDGFSTKGITIRNSITIDGQGHTIDAQGKATIFFVNADNVVLKNIIFKNGNSADHGGAIYWQGTAGSVSGSTFIGNSAASSGGAIYWQGTAGSVSGSTFIGNSANVHGGAIDWIDTGGSVSGSTFIGNSANVHGGAIFWTSTGGSVFGSTFIGNSADWYGGAIFWQYTGTVINCNFESNSAVKGNPIYSNEWGSVADSCIFKNNYDNSNTIIRSPTLNVDNFTSFYGSGDKITFNLTTNSGIPVTNGNISISLYFKNGTWFDNYSCLSGEGWIPNLPVGLYYAIFNTEYAGFQPINRTIKIIPNIPYYANVTSVTTTNKTVNITAKSNVPQDILEGKLLFILPNSTEIIANYGGNGIWWVVHTFEKCMKYEVSAYYEGWDNVTVNNATITVNKLQTELSADAIISTYNIGKDLVITLKDSNGNPVSNATVTVDLDGAKTYTTDKNGQVKVSTAGLIPKIYTAKISFAGDNNYNESSIDVGITVNKATPILKAKKKTYKAKTKTKKFTIVLKDNTGKPIQNAKVRLMVKKITKSNKKGGSDKESKADKKKNFAVTNNKGKATFKVLRNKKGKYNAKVKFYSNEFYNKVTKTVKIVIK